LGKCRVPHGAASDTRIGVCAQADDEYMISDYDLLVSRYISVPRTYGSFTPAALVAGIVRGMLDAAGFTARCCP
jgi:hypothetical protein